CNPTRTTTPPTSSSTPLPVPPGVTTAEVTSKNGTDSRRRFTAEPFESADFPLRDAPSFHAHHENVFAGSPSRLANAAQDNPLFFQARTRCSQVCRSRLCVLITPHLPDVGPDVTTRVIHRIRINYPPLCGG